MTDRKSAKEKEFSRQVLPHIGSLYGFAVRLKGNPTDADDLVQETFLKAYRFWDRFEQGTNIHAWLFRIMKNSFINLYRKESKRPCTVEYFEATTPASGYHSIPDVKDLNKLVFDSLIDDDISGAVSDLPEDFRTTVILRDIEGLTYVEIARFANCPLGTVRSRLHRGRRLLHSALFDYATERGFARGARNPAGACRVP